MNAGPFLYVMIFVIMIHTCATDNKVQHLSKSLDAVVQILENEGVGE